MRERYDVAIIGGGPAGLSCALLLGRARRSTLVIDDGHQRNRPVRESHGFLGFDGCPPSEFLNQARAQLEGYPTIEHVQGHVENVAGEIDRFKVSVRDRGETVARRIVLAGGMYDDLPHIDGIRDLWGRYVFVCPYCDGWEFRDARIGVTGTATSAVELAKELWNWSHDLVVCPTSQEPIGEENQRWLAAADVKVAGLPSQVMENNQNVVIALRDGETVTCDVIFVCAPLKQRSDLPEKLGCELTDRQTIRVDENNQTTTAGCYASGDCITRYHQLIFAASSGARAAIAINDEFYELDARALARSSRSRS